MSENWGRKKSKEQVLDGELEHRGKNNIQGQQAEIPQNATSSSSVSVDTEVSKEEKDDKEAMEEECTLVWTELDETVRSSIAKAVQDRVMLN